MMMVETFESEAKWLAPGGDAAILSAIQKLSPGCLIGKDIEAEKQLTPAVPHTPVCS
jgi:hypothetical protein